MINDQHFLITLSFYLREIPAAGGIPPDSVSSPTVHGGRVISSHLC